MRFPRVGERVEIQVAGLPNVRTLNIQYSFTIDRCGGVIIVHIPGHYQGPDNCTPKYPQQEEWLDSLEKLMKPSWDCQWTIYDEETLKYFLDMLDPFLKDYKVWVNEI